MLGKVKITNFQSHASTQLDLCPGINVITGGSDKGKTAIRRAINWVIHNRPLGEEMIRHGTDGAEVTIERIHRGTSTLVTRTRGKSVNSYTITTPDGTVSDPLTGFGNSPPKEVDEITNFQDINLQKQFSPYFLVFDSPGQVATYIRSITRLDEIDKVRGEIERKLKNTQADMKSRRDDLSETLADLSKLNCIDLDRLGDCIEQAQQILETKQQLLAVKDRLTNVIDKIRKIDAAAIHIPEGVDRIFADVESAEKSHEKLLTSRTSLSNLIYKLGSIKIIALDVETSMAMVDAASALIAASSTINKRYKTLMDIVQQIVDIDDAVIKINQSIEGATAERDAIMGQLTECPHCGSKLDDSGLARLLSGGCK